MTIKRPDQSEFAPFYAGYIGKVPDSGPGPLMKDQIGELEKLRALPEDKANHAYAARQVDGEGADRPRRRRRARVQLPADCASPAATRRRWPASMRTRGRRRRRTASARWPTWSTR